MKIAYISTELNIKSGGGSNRSLDLTATFLSERGHSIEVFVQEHEIENSSPYGINKYSGSESPISTAKETYKLLRDISDEFDILHVFKPRLIPIAGFAKRAFDTPVIGRLNGYTFCSNLSMMDGECHACCNVMKRIRHSERNGLDVVKTSPIYAWDGRPSKFGFNNVDRLRAISPAVKTIYSEFGINEDKIDVIGNISDPVFSVDGTNGSNDGFNVLYVGRLVKSKGVHLLIEAMDRVDPSVTLTIVGDGSEEDRLVNQAEALGIDDRINFVGWIEREALPGFYSKADVFVHPGLWPEPSGNTIIEALQCRTPVIVSDIGGPPWIAGNAGIRFPCGDVDALAECISRVAKDEDLRRDLIENSDKEVERFAPQTIVDNVESLYLSLIS